MSKLSIQETNSIAKDMKYEALYWALGYEETSKGIFTKNGRVINSNMQYAKFSEMLTIIGADKISLDSHKSFVVLECVDKLLDMGYSPSEIIVDLDNEYDIYCNNIYIKCYEWGHEEKDNIIVKKKTFVSVVYSSRLVSGVIERKYTAKDENGTFKAGIFEGNKKEKYVLYNPTRIDDPNFIIEGTKILRYVGDGSKVTIPEGVTELSPCLFWDNQNIVEVVLPESLIDISGDTFYNCSNLENITIPKNVRFMGNNPFAGCPKLSLKNDSESFAYEDGTLYTKDHSRLIYRSIKNPSESYSINQLTKIIGKHSFYLCSNLKEVIIPHSVIKLENNPFSGCEKINVINMSSRYHVIDSVIYDEDKSSVIGCLNSIKTDSLELLPVKRICRNSFWNCKGIKKIVLPSTLEVIGYNPFVGCSNIEFVSNSNNFRVDHGALFSKDRRKLICYPAKFAIGNIHLPDETITLERGAFSGARELTSINLHNVSIISKTCFTNCDNLEEVHCSDLVCYIGEWAFAHCKKLKSISISKDCFVDKNVLMNSNAASFEVREERENYVIESDNKYTLESLAKSYQGKIKSILIDPPYNSKIDYIGYKDSEFDNGYLDFMKERISIAYDLLSQDGFLVINIDEGEARNLARLCSEFFGSLVKVHKWEKLHQFFDKNRNVDPKKKRVKYEYIIFCAKSKDSVLNNIMQPSIVNGTLTEHVSKVPSTFRCFGTNSSAKDEINELFGRRDYFATPKPLKLMKELVRTTTDKDSIVLDFFAGSGTTGHAVHALNAEDGGSRKYILVSNNESNICQEVTLKRMNIIGSQAKFLS